MNAAKPDARAAAIEILGRVLRENMRLDHTLETSRELTALEPRDRAFARLLTATVLRRLGQIDALLAEFLERPIPPRAGAVQDVLRIGAAQLLFLQTPAHAAVATSVELASRAGHPGMKGLVNAVLRRVAREGGDILAQQDSARLNTPDWLWQSWAAAYGEDTARAIALAHLAEAPLDFSVKADVEAWAQKLDAKKLPTGTLRRAPGGAIEELPGFAEGAWWVQDAAAALPAKLLGPVAGETVADLCAAPGGKTAQLAAAGARVIAIDRAPERLQRVADNLARLHLAAECVAADAEAWRPPEKLRFILLDAPCTVTGAIRRNPDVPRGKRAEDVTRLAATQARMLRAAIDMLAPGGTLVYCTCSLQPEEGPRQIERLLAQNPPIARRPIDAAEIGGLGQCITPDGDLRTLPCQLADDGGLDGFYACRLVRRP